MAAVENDGLCNEKNQIHMKENNPFMRGHPGADKSGVPDRH
jgi:hypothetical protein